MNSSKPQIDNYVWGSEEILWGNSLDHQYTFKVLKPKVGRAGCLSLQSHKDKSETWLVTRGLAWALVIKDWTVTTFILKEGDVVNLPAGVIHRLMGLTPDCSIAEASTPDKHAADKTAIKDVIRWHCVFGRECVKATNEFDGELIEAAIKFTNDAIASIESGSIPVPDSYKLLYY